VVVLLQATQEQIPFSNLKFLPPSVQRSVGYFRTLHERRAKSITSYISFTHHPHFWEFVEEWLLIKEERKCPGGASLYLQKTSESHWY